ncbi:MAG: hypothetical protein CMJ20_10265 [Phycisphaeraceae bacterium]|nr:hypothetical protein [Phycisphaeraceae bacterium]
MGESPVDRLVSNLISIGGLIALGIPCFATTCPNDSESQTTPMFCSDHSGQARNRDGLAAAAVHLENSIRHHLMTINQHQALFGKVRP